MTVSPSVREFINNQASYDKRRKWLHRLLQHVGGRLVKAEVSGLEHVPRHGGAILMMNHSVWLDPVIATLVIPHRYVISMAKAETNYNPAFAVINRLWGNYVVRRGTVDREALNNSIELLRNGQLILIAPEGTRSKHGLKEPRDGLAFVASKASAWVVPTAIVGASDWRSRWVRLRRTYAKVVFGRPFRFRLAPDEKLNKELRANMMREAMYQLALAIPPEFAHYRGKYADLDAATTHHLIFA